MGEGKRKIFKCTLAPSPPDTVTVLLFLIPSVFLFCKLKYHWFQSPSSTMICCVLGWSIVIVPQICQSSNWPLSMTSSATARLIRCVKECLALRAANNSIRNTPNNLIFYGTVLRNQMQMYTKKLLRWYRVWNIVLYSLRSTMTNDAGQWSYYLGMMPFWFSV